MRVKPQSSASVQVRGALCVRLMLSVMRDGESRAASCLYSAASVSRERSALCRACVHSANDAFAARFRCPGNG